MALRACRFCSGKKANLRSTFSFTAPKLVFFHVLNGICAKQFFDQRGFFLFQFTAESAMSCFFAGNHIIFGIPITPWCARVGFLRTKRVKGIHVGDDDVIDRFVGAANSTEVLDVLFVVGRFDRLPIETDDFWFRRGRRCVDGLRRGDWLNWFRGVMINRENGN